MKGDRAVLSERSRRLIFTYLFSVYLLAAVSETLISPLFPLIRDDLGLSVAQQASLVAALTTTIGVFNLVGGALGYRSGDRRIVRAAALALAIGTAISGAAGSYLPLLLGQIVIGVGSGLFFGPGLASIGRMYTATRGRAVASYGLAYSVGLALASLLGQRRPGHVAVDVLGDGLPSRSCSRSSRPTWSRPARRPPRRRCSARSRPISPTRSTACRS